VRSVNNGPRLNIHPSIEMKALQAPSAAFTERACVGRRGFKGTAASSPEGCDAHYRRCGDLALARPGTRPI
jgi:hypothetical protein